MRKGVSLTDRGRVLPGPAPWFSLALPFSRPSTWPLVGGKKRRLPGVNRNPFSPPMRRGAQPPNPPLFHNLSEAGIPNRSLQAIRGPGKALGCAGLVCVLQGSRPFRILGGRSSSEIGSR